MGFGYVALSSIFIIIFNPPLPSFGQIYMTFIGAGIPMYTCTILWFHGNIISTDKSRFSLIAYVCVFISYFY
jgi:hypothetical protein